MATGKTESDGPPPGHRLLAELRWVHERIRHDLRICSDLAARVAEGASPEEVRAEIESLQTSSPLWKLRINCLYYCRFVHSHHHIEDVALFPAIRGTNPELGDVVDRLEADHRTVSARLDEVEAAADALVVDDTAAVRARVVACLGDLGADLLAHLAFEEESIGPAILAWEGWPGLGG